MTLRVNRRHGNAESYLEKLAAESIPARALDEYAVMLEEAVPVSRLPGFSDGLVSVQDFGAQRAAYLLNPKDGERILMPARHRVARLAISWNWQIVMLPLWI